MTSPTVARLVLLALLAGGFGLAGWQLLSSAPQSKRERPAAPVPLVDVVDSTPRDVPLQLEASGPVVSAFELDIRPQVGGLIVGLHPDFEPGGRIPAGEPILEIESADYQLAVDAAQAEIAKARAAIALEQGRRVVAREELKTLRGSLTIDATSEALALRKPQLRQVEAELAAAENQLKRAQLDLARTRLTLPFDLIVLSRSRVSGEVVAARELVGRVTRADEYWVELRTQPDMLGRIRARQDDRPGSRVIVRDAAATHDGEVVRIRADLAEGSRLGGIIAAVPIAPGDGARLLLGQYVEARIDAGTLAQVIAVPRRAVRDNRRVWVVDDDGKLQVRDAAVAWESEQTLLLERRSLHDGDHVVVSRIAGLVPGASVRSRQVDPATGRVIESASVAGHE